MAAAGDRFNLFLKLSVALTGFSRLDLLGTGVAADLLDTLTGALPPGVADEFLAAGASLSDGWSGSAAHDEAALTAILDDPKLGDIARSLTVLWYSGRWAALPDVWRAAYGSSPLDTSRVVSGQAYQAGLQWVVAGAHPPGGLPQGFAAWSLPPEGIAK
jgi:hypothetical protein